MYLWFNSKAAENTPQPPHYVLGSQKVWGANRGTRHSETNGNQTMLLGDCFEHWFDALSSPEPEIAPVDPGRARVRSPASDARAGPDPFAEAVARFAKSPKWRLVLDSF